MTIHTLYNLFCISTGICTDTRKISVGSLFICLKGPNFNANRFAEIALEKGAIAVIADEQLFPDNPSIFLVEDALVALQDLATYHRKRLSLNVIAVCGSNGKTTTKELISRVLSTRYITFATPGNLNNHIGVPLSVLQLTKDHQIAVLELGANGPGEIELLCNIAQPNFGLITNIGKDHLEGFGSVEGVGKANEELLTYLEGIPNALFFVNTSEPSLSFYDFSNVDRFTFPSDNDDCVISQLSSNPYLQLEAGVKIETNLVGQYNFANIVTAWAIGKFFDTDPLSSAEAIKGYVPGNMRSQIVETGRNTVLLDAYNANPSSMSLALTNLQEIDWKGLPKAFVLGDMFELGEDAIQEHIALGQQASTLGIVVKVFIGELMKHAALNCQGSLHFNTRQEASDWLAQNKLQNYFILIKGSRSMGLEKIVDAL